MEYIFIVLLTVIAALVGAITYTLYKGVNKTPTLKPDFKPAESTEKPKSGPKYAWYLVKKALYHIFIDGLSGMALGLFATLIIGTIICQIASFIPGEIGMYIDSIGRFAKTLTGAGIGLGVAYKLKKPVLVGVSAAVVGMIGAYAPKIIAGAVFSGAADTFLGGVGEPLGAFIGALVAVDVGGIVVNKTKIDIIVTPLCAIISGAVLGLLVGPPISGIMNALGKLIETATEQQPFIMGMLVSVLMGMALTLPISSAAIGLSLSLGGIAAGAATVGCCCQMIGFAVMSFRENKVGGLIAQGVGTSMLQMPNIIKKPIVWLPPIIASAILGPVSSVWLKMISNSVGSGMGTAGLVGPIMTFTTMLEAGGAWWLILIEILLIYFILPAAICLGLSEVMRKFGLIKKGDLLLDL